MSTSDPATLAAIFKAYDVRGHRPRPGRRGPGPPRGQRLRRGDRCRRRRGRPRHAALLAGDGRAFAEGAARAGADVTLIGLATTDQLYFASGHLERPGAMFTASHNPAQYNGIKMCRACAAPVGMETGLAEIRDLVAAGEPTDAPTRRARSPSSDLLADYADHLLDAGAGHGPRLKVVVDAGNGMAGHTAPAVLGQVDADVVPTVLRARRHLPQPRGQPDRAGQPGRPPGRACASPAPTSGWPSTATRTAASWSTSAASWSARAC